MSVKLGDRIRLLSMPNDPCPIEPGAEGVVAWLGERLTNPELQQVGVLWDNGRQLILLEGIDQYEVIS